MGEQIYGPYGNSRYTAGSINTPKGYTGQIHDAVTGLDYYNARYYDPVIGMFLSVDSVQGNVQGMNPYAYVGENPETNVDPTGQRFCVGVANGGCAPIPPSGAGGQASDPVHKHNPPVPVQPKRGKVPPVKRPSRLRSVDPAPQPMPPGCQRAVDPQCSGHTPTPFAPDPCPGQANCEGATDPGGTTNVSKIFPGYREFYAKGFEGLLGFIDHLKELRDILSSQAGNGSLAGAIIMGLAGMFTFGSKAALGFGGFIFALGAAVAIQAGNLSPQDTDPEIVRLTHAIARLEDVRDQMLSDMLHGRAEFARDETQVFDFTETTVTVLIHAGARGYPPIQSSYEEYNLETYNLSRV